jgi:hypothetical protein
MHSIEDIIAMVYMVINSVPNKLIHLDFDFVYFNE